MLINGPKGKFQKYSEAVRKFSFRIQFHSTGAYRELRKFFNNRLPTIRCLQKWLRSVDSKPGITQAALDIIAEKAKLYKQEGKQLCVCLMDDETGINGQPSWNEETMKFVGFDETIKSKGPRKRNSSNEENTKTPLVKNALVYMVCGDDFRIAVAYKFLVSMDAVDRAAFTLEVIRAIDKTGAKVISLTSDGLAANLSVARLLGADLKNNKPYFMRPNGLKEKIYIVLDPPHMIKLLRQYLSRKKLQHGENELNWNLLETLASKQHKDNFSLTKKLTKNHIEWEHHKMNVKKAVQIFSNDNADALDQLREDKYEDFSGSEKLSEFLRLVNNIFDVVNIGEGKPTDKQFKQPICEANLEKVRELFDSFKRFVSGLTMESNRKKERHSVLNETGFLGLLVNIESTLGIYQDYVKGSHSPYFYTFKYGQDSLETWFSLIRASLGHNFNPNPLQFEMAYRKLLFCTPHICKTTQTNCNVEFPSTLLNVSSAATAKPQCQVNAVLQSNSIEIEIDFDTVINMVLEPYDQHLFALTAMDIENEIIWTHKAQNVSKCQDCLNVFAQNVKINDSFIAKKISRGKVTSQPCLHTFQILLFSNYVAEQIESPKQIDFKSVAKTIMNELINIEPLYELSHFEGHNNTKKNCHISHKEEFILEILLKFLHMKSKNICARIVQEEQDEARERRKNRRDRINTGYC